MKKILVVAALLSSFAAAQEDPWKDQADKTAKGIAAAEAAIESASYQDTNYGGGGGASDPAGKEHAKAVLKKQKQRKAAIEQGRKLQIPAARKDRSEYPTQVKGEAKILLGGEWKPLREGFPLMTGDRIKTGKDSRLTLWLSGGFLTLGPEADAKITEEKVVTLTAGLMHWENLAAGGKEWQCRTPSVNATIKGTEFDMAVKDGKSVFSPVSGLVELRSTAAKPVPPGPPKSLPSGWAGRVESKQGELMLQKGGKGPWRFLQAGERLEFGDEIRTGAQAKARLSLAGGFNAELLHQTTFELKKNAYSLLDGLIRAWHKVEAQAFESDVRFMTPRSVAAVRGTEFQLGFSKEDGRDEFVPESGVLEVTTKRDPKLGDLDLWWNKD